MSPSAHHTSEQLQYIIEDENHSNTDLREVPAYVENGQKVPYLENSRTVLHTVPNQINEEFGCESHDEEERFLHAQLI
jgi:hypothetical protein